MSPLEISPVGNPRNEKGGSQGQEIDAHQGAVDADKGCLQYQVSFLTAVRQGDGKSRLCGQIFPEFSVKLSRQFHGLGIELFRMPVPVRSRRQVVDGRWSDVKPLVMLLFSLDFRVHPKSFKGGVPRLQGLGGKLCLRYFGKQMFRA